MVGVAAKSTVKISRTFPAKIHGRTDCQQCKMPREAEPSLNERTFLLQALQENLRLDGRGFHDYRPLELNFNDGYGVAEVKLGKTRYLNRDCAYEATSSEEADYPVLLLRFLPR